MTDKEKVVILQTALQRIASMGTTSDAQTIKEVLQEATQWIKTARQIADDALENTRGNP